VERHGGGTCSGKKTKDLAWLLRHCGFAEGFDTANGCVLFLTQLSQKAPAFYGGACRMFQLNLVSWRDMDVPQPMVFTKDGYYREQPADGSGGN
jgi:hypothetical protein